MKSKNNYLRQNEGESADYITSFIDLRHVEVRMFITESVQRTLLDAMKNISV